MPSHGKVTLTVEFDVFGSMDAETVKDFVRDSIKHEAVTLDGADAMLTEDGLQLAKWTVDLSEGEHDDAAGRKSIR